MSDNTYTHISFLLDRSGSMEAIRTDIEGGFKSFIDEQRTAPGTCTVTLTQFDDRYETVYENVPVADAPALNLQPRGMTALLDSMARVIADTSTALKNLPKDKRPGTVIVAVMTDGLENASKEWTHPTIKALVEKQTAKGWQFLYMGANQDAVEVGTSMGISREHTITYAPAMASASMATTSGLVSQLRSARMSDPNAVMTAYSNADRDKLIEHGGVGSDEVMEDRLIRYVGTGPCSPIGHHR
jgi:hypothetical protein